MLTPGEWTQLQRLSDEVVLLLGGMRAHVGSGDDRPAVEDDGTPTGAALLALSAQINWLLAKGSLAQFPFTRAVDFEANQRTVPTSRSRCEYCGKLLKKVDKTAHVRLTESGDAVWNRGCHHSLSDGDAVVRPVHQGCVDWLPVAFVLHFDAEGGRAWG